MQSFFLGLTFSILLIIIKCDDLTTYICNQTSSCGCSSKAIVQARIIGGRSVLGKSWGWTVGIYYSKKYFCVGSLISSDLIITAAHCIINDPTKLSTITIIAGSNLLSNSDNLGQIRHIHEIFIHPDFDKNTNLNDIAIIRLSSPFDMLDKRLTIICLPHAITSTVEYPVPGTTLVVVGWGVTKYGSTESSSILRQVTVKAVASTSKDCSTDKKEILNVTIHFCAGVSDGGKDTCQGDSGGPIMAFISNRWHLMGITSTGYGCGLAGHSGIYTRVAYYIPFIETIKNKNQTLYSSIIVHSYNNCERLQTKIIKEFLLFTLVVLIFYK